MLFTKVTARLVRSLSRQFNNSALPPSLMSLSSCFFSSSMGPGTDTNEKKHSVVEQLCAKMRATGPISVAEYMREILTSPNKGYYMSRDMFGTSGDFVTSPELSQMFGELIALWLINEWSAGGSPPEVQVVELGPGRGTLSKDILRTFGQFKKMLDFTTMTLHMVEVSPTLSQIQYSTLCTNRSTHSTTNVTRAKDTAGTNDSYYMEGTTDCGRSIYWHRTLDGVPKEKFTLYVAHEFFDALPIHKFINVDGQWKEIFVDICLENSSFRFVTSSHATLASKTLIKSNEARRHVEVCPQAGLIVHEIASRILQVGGAALIADYGHFGTKEDTLRAFKNHQLLDVFSHVGDADLTADVDFKYLKEVAETCRAATAGPISQHDFLKNMGIDMRLMMLLRSCDDDDVRKKLVGSYDMIVNPEKMGERFQFLAIVPPSRVADVDTSPVTAFYSEPVVKR